MRHTVNVALIMIAAMAGCVPSIHGIATEENTVWSEQLLGTWGDADETSDPNAEKWQFERYDKESSFYKLTHRSEGKAGEFLVCMVQVGDMLFLDLFPGENEALENNNYLHNMHLVAAHTFVKVDELGKTLKIQMMKPDEVKKLVEENPAVVKHEIRGDQVILTAGPDELRDFLLQYVDQIFDDKDGGAMVKIAAAEGE